MPEKFNLNFEHAIEIVIAEAEYKTTVDSVTDTSIIINTPFVQGQALELQPGTEIRVTYTNQLAIYSFTEPIKSVSGKPEYRFSINLPAQVDRTQRRNYVRVDVGLQMTFYAGEPDTPAARTYTTKTRDLSGGGLRFDFDSKLGIGTTLDILLDIPSFDSGTDCNKVSAVGRVVRCLPAGKGLREKFSIGVEFTIIDKQDREAIIRYLFEYQRQLRKKGLL